MGLIYNEEQVHKKIDDETVKIPKDRKVVKLKEVVEKILGVSNSTKSKKNSGKTEQYVD